jgi:hypothetical protein
MAMTEAALANRQQIPTGGREKGYEDGKTNRDL